MLGQVLIIGSIRKLKVGFKRLVVGSIINGLNSFWRPFFIVFVHGICFEGSEDDPATKNVSPVTTKRPRNKKQAEVDIDFTKALDEGMPDIFAPPKNPKSLLLPANRAPCNTKLPEDCHYQPEDLVKLFLLPNVKVILFDIHITTISLFVEIQCFYFLFNVVECSNLGAVPWGEGKKVLR
jgi:hypothetical protein